jgi:anti-sigma regulatory factor (Ser/Thr protein kinase)
MCRDSQARYPSAVSSTPGQVRSFVERTLVAEVAGEQLDVAVSSAVLVASELATNAVRAGTGPVVVDLEIRREHVRVSVEDDARGWPVPQVHEPIEAHGRGLLIVATLAREWGVHASGLGKRVWATLDLPAGLVHASPCGPTQTVNDAER